MVMARKRFSDEDVTRLYCKCLSGN